MYKKVTQLCINFTIQLCTNIITYLNVPNITVMDQKKHVTVAKQF